MSYLLPKPLALAGPDGPSPAPDLDEKLGALAGLVGEVLRLHDACFRVATHADEAVLEADDRRARDRVMGDPERYAEVLYAGDDGPTGEGADVRVRAAVFVYFGRASGEGRADTEGAFRALCESRRPERPGLLHALRAQGLVRVQAGPRSGHELALGAPTNVTAALVLPDGRPAEWRHELAFSLTIS